MSRFSEEVELEMSVRRLRENFHGKIPVDKATVLMRRYRNNHRMVAMEIILMKDRDLDEEDKWSLENDTVVRNVVQKLQTEEREQSERDARSSGASDDSKRSKQPKTSKQGTIKDRDIEELGKRLRVLPLTEKNMRMFDHAQKNLMPSVIHQFACETCDQVWWRRVPQRKRVSRCRRCKKKYDPVPPHKMWGIAEFFCLNCSRSFKGFGRMDIGSPCYICRSIILPTQILPPRRNMRDQGPRRRQQHSCLAEDCYNRQEPHVTGTECVHPRSRQKNNKPQVVNPSLPHISSGSTVNTCLSQGSLLEQVYELILDDIGEEESGEESDSSGSGHTVSS
ncbi:repressor of yield of DENV protein [Astyanax mexicanus]|uniref:Repressor of yield of DENV protein n=1 Tax=Astyanax mexicanus TaxID=7994 RepID=A0A8B9J6T2_ASTMX|nr:repressor of yield of DENV protein [Astyanax mexicanus]